jgi:hypothetical protein
MHVLLTQLDPGVDGALAQVHTPLQSSTVRGKIFAVSILSFLFCELAVNNISE